MTQVYDRKRKAWVPKKKRVNEEAREREAARLAELERFKERIVPIENGLATLEGKVERVTKDSLDLLRRFDDELKEFRKQVRKEIGQSSPPDQFDAELTRKAEQTFFDHDDLDAIMAMGQLRTPTVMPKVVLERLVEMARTHVRARELFATGNKRS